LGSFNLGHEAVAQTLQSSLPGCRSWGADLLGRLAVPLDRWWSRLQTDVVPTTRYAKSGEVNIAYQVFGDGSVDLVFVPGFISHIELAWEEPYLARFLRRLAAFTRVIFFDKRGTGLSDPVARPPGLTERMDDIRAVMDAAGSQTAALFGVSDGGCLCIAYAVAHSERSAALITYGSYARRLRSADYPWGWSAEHLYEVLSGMDQGWASGNWWAAANPSVANDERYQAWWARYLRAAASPSMGRGALGLNAGLDIRHLLPKVDLPTLVIHRTHEQWVDVGNSRYLVAHISGARLVEASGVDHRPWLGDADEILAAIETFITGTVARPRTARYAAGAEALTRREREIVALSVAGETAPAIAKALFLSERTVESHLARAYAKLGVHSKLELTRRAAEFGLAADSI
jgi:pimeloyl-ACP methyl ester carboxylesterase/DNA-binding CsgD family transcriptional regulator